MKDLEAGGTLEARNRKSQRQSGNKAVPFRKVEGEIERAVRGTSARGCTRFFGKRDAWGPGGEPFAEGVG